MIFTIVLLHLLTIVHSAPAPAFTRLPTVQLCIYGPGKIHYTPEDQITSNKCPGELITLPIGAVQSRFEQNPLLLQGIGIEGVEEGITREVLCRANLRNSSKVKEVSSKNKGTTEPLDEGRDVRVTALSCEFAKYTV
ncbi:hypothetical protein GQ44DRAFT_770939 [Phaeosphaeriaceae sp. PMI808]|nr:hypothetical protein GQ44DRAFT_770939 [Phaeosphaeriaceae sp. PMI808]